jgi:hypothetical protein
MNNEYNIKKRAGFRVGLIVALVIGVTFSYATFFQNVKIVNDEHTKSWHVIWEGSLADAAEANPGASAGGILEVFITNHTATPATTYNTNLTEAAALGWAGADDSQINLAYGTYFDIVIKVRGNATQCQRGATWWDSDLKVELSSDTGLVPQIGNLTPATGCIIVNASSNSFLWMNFYIQGAGSGYYINKGATAQVTTIKFSAYY